MSELCLPRGLSKDHLETLDSVARRSRPLQRDETIFRAGETMSSLFAVRSGSFKLFTTSDEGSEQIIGFYFPGEIMGLDGLDNDRHACTAMALETSTVCSFPVANLKTICQQVPALQDQIFRVMGREISAENELLLTISKKNADERIATFLGSLSSRFQRLGYSANEFKLSMSRQEIGNYLGLTIETVSRVFSRLQKLGIITSNRKFVSIRDLPRLRAICTGGSHEGCDASQNSVA